MANLSKGRADIKERVLSKCWDFIDSNFHKFDDDVRVKIALELCKKDIPQEVKGDLFGSAEVAKVIAGLSAADLECLIATCRERKSEAKSV